MAIDIKELRLGNIIHYDGDITHYPDYEDEEDVVIGCISEYELNGYAYTCYHEINCQRCYHVNKPSLFSPIPLTEEWLVKFGFKKDSNPFAGGVFDSPIMGNHIDYNSGIFTYRNYSTSLIDILYTHQLQNLFFALTGSELTI